MTASGNKITGKIFRFDLNEDHTHFIIYDAEKSDSDNMNYDTFRNRAELLFTKSLFYYYNQKKDNGTM